MRRRRSQKPEHDGWISYERQDFGNSHEALACQPLQNKVQRQGRCRAPEAGMGQFHLQTPVEFKFGLFLFFFMWGGSHVETFPMSVC